MPQATTWPYCNTTTDLQRAYNEIESFFRIDTLTGFVLAAGQQATLEKRNTGYFGVIYEDGEEMTSQTSVANVEANADSFYYDSTNDILYIHPSGITTEVSISSLTTKAVTHSLGHYPFVKVFGADGVGIDFELVHNSVNQFTCNFAVAQSGTIRYSNRSNNWDIGGAVTSKTITHNLGYQPDVQIFDLSGDVLDAEVTHNNNNEFTLAFAVAQDGTVVMVESMTDEGYIITGAVDDWNDLKTTMRNDAMEIVESMLDPNYPRPLPFSMASYNTENYDADIRRATALITCMLIIEYRDPDNPLAERFRKRVWDDETETGILFDYHVGKRKFSFEPTKDEFKGNLEVLTRNSTSTGIVQIAGNPMVLRRRKYRIVFTTGGVPETAKFKFSDDGGLTYDDADSHDTYQNWFHLIGGIWIRCIGTFVANDAFEIEVADPMETVRGRIGSIPIDVSGYGGSA